MDTVNEIENLRKALKFYGDGEHFIQVDDTAWDTVSGEPQNYWCDEAGTALIQISKAPASGAAGTRQREYACTASPEAANQSIAGRCCGLFNRSNHGKDKGRKASSRSASHHAGSGTHRDLQGLRQQLEMPRFPV